MNRAMLQVDQVTQRNASAAEELASTAEELAAQAEALSQLVSFFRVEDGDERGARVAAPSPGWPAEHPMGRLRPWRTRSGPRRTPTARGSGFRVPPRPRSRARTVSSSASRC